jgi:hypothetical protein
LTLNSAKPAAVSKSSSILSLLFLAALLVLLAAGVERCRGKRMNRTGGIFVGFY